MLSLRNSPSFCHAFSHSPSFPHTFSPSKHLRHPNPSSFSPSFKPRSIKISCSGQTVDHVVLVNVKDGTDSSKVNAMLNDLKSLVNIDGVLHLTVGPILRHRHITAGKTSPELRFTHMLHSRYRTKEDLDFYSAHPDHLSVVRGSLFPNCDDILAVDWVDAGSGGESPLPAPPQGSAIRVRFLRPKEGEEDVVKGMVLGVAGGTHGGGAGEIVQVSCGENISPARAKGFSAATLMVFPGQKEIEKMELDDEGLGLEKVKDHVESVFVADYLVA